jgi:CheY-like chemotaxis protein
VKGVVADSTAPVILVVEDDPLLRMLAVEFVQEAGFGTLEAGDADQAIAILESCGKVAVLFTDIDMPGSMDGLKLARVASERWPAMDILIASGHVRLLQSELPPDSRFLGKPYSAAAMVAELHSLIGHTAWLTPA